MLFGQALHYRRGAYAATVVTGGLLLGFGSGIVLISPEGHKLNSAVRFKFKATNNTVEYEAFIQGLNKAIDLGVKDLKVYCDSEIIVK